MARMPFKHFAGFGLLACLGFTSGVQARDRLMQPAETLVAAAKAHVVAAMDVPPVHPSPLLSIRRTHACVFRSAINPFRPKLRFSLPQAGP